MVFFFDKNFSGESTMLANKSAIKNEIISNKELAEELHKPIIIKFNKRKVHTFYRQYLGRRSSRYATDK